jgi:hypothetical protein
MEGTGHLHASGALTLKTTKQKAGWAKELVWILLSREKYLALAGH